MAALLWACAAIDVAGVYKAPTMAVILEVDGNATVSSVKGRWRLDGSRVIVDLDNGESMVFDYADDSLIARQWDRGAWGEAGPGTLHRESTSGRGLRG